MMDTRIGKLNNGQYYAYIDYSAGPVVGTLAEVCKALGIECQSEQAKQQTFTVTIHFQYPSWDEVDGIQYQGIVANSKRDAIRKVRGMAQGDGHAITGRGRYWFKAVIG